MGEGARTGVASGEAAHAPAAEVGQASGAWWATLAGLGRSLRPWQWYKQVILYLGLVFSLNATDPVAWVHVTAGAGLWCLVSGSMYLLNDVADREADRRHPEKRHRPVASGQVSVAAAVGAAAILLATSAVAAWSLSPVFLGILALYVAQNLAYSAVLKDVLFVDLLVIGIGFVLRAVGGVVLVGAPTSPWLVLTTFLAALLLGVGKRQAEARRVDEAETRATLEEYSGEMLDFMLPSVATTLLVAYCLYTFFARSPAMMATIPFAFYAVFRYAHVVHEEQVERPERLLLDRAMVANLALWSLTIVAVLYLLPAAAPEAAAALAGVAP